MKNLKIRNITRKAKRDICFNDSIIKTGFEQFAQIDSFKNYENNS